MSKLVAGAVRILHRMSEQPYLMAVRDGIIATFPIVVAGTLALFLKNIPVEFYQNFMQAQFGNSWIILDDTIARATTGIISVVITISIGFYLAEHYNRTHVTNQVPPIVFILVILSSFFCLADPLDSIESGPIIAMQWLGVQGVLFAIIAALSASFVFSFFLRFKKLRMAFFSGGSSAVTHMVDTLIPALLTILFFSFIYTCTRYIFPENLGSIFLNLTVIFGLDDETNIGTATFLTFLRQVFWFIGTHGGFIFEPIMNQIYASNQQENLDLFLLTGKTLYYGASEAGYTAKIFTRSFFVCYPNVGGAGATLGLLFSIIYSSSARSIQKLARVSVIPSIFNINEIVLFGVPVVLNPFLLVPFLLAPVLATLLAFYACYFGFVPVSIEPIAWNTPIFINSYVSTGSYSAVLLQLAIIFVTTIIYIPFIKINIKFSDEAFKSNYNKLIAIVNKQREKEFEPHIITLPSPLGPIAQSLIVDLREGLEKKQFLLEYQPLVDSSTGKVYGFESLMRWDHPTLGRVPPSLFIAIAEETRDINELGFFALDTVVKQIALWKVIMPTFDCPIAINISPVQLADATLPDYIAGLLDKYDISPHLLKIEITESMTIDSNDVQGQVLERLQQMGLALAIDDFGMGHSSLTYLKIFKVSSLKMDVSLTKDALESRNSREIIVSVTDLCASLGINLIAEYIEDEKHLLLMRALGCHNIQGYFYSKPLDPSECLAFLREQHAAYGEMLPIDREVAMQMT